MLSPAGRGGGQSPATTIVAVAEPKTQGEKRQKASGSAEAGQKALNAVRTFLDDFLHEAGSPDAADGVDALDQRSYDKVLVRRSSTC